MENKSTGKKDYHSQVMGMPAQWFFAGAVIILISAWMGVLPANMIGGFAVCMALGNILFYISMNLSFIRETLGGMAMIALTCGILKYFNFWPETLLNVANGFVNGSTDFITFYICGLICGSIMGMNRKLLIQAGVRYFIPIVGGVFVAYSFAGIVGQMIGTGWKDALLYVAGPIMGGGTGGGAIPMSEIYEEVTGVGKDVVFSKIYPAVTIGGITSLFFAAIINSIGKKFPKLSGNGALMRGFDLSETESHFTFEMSLQDLGVGLFTSVSFFILGKIIGNFIPTFHFYAYVIVIVAAVKIMGILPERVEFAAMQWYKFLSSVFTITLMAGVGLTMVNIGELLAVLTPAFFLLCASVVLGGVIGAGFTGLLVKFYFVESAITAGLCMSNVGGNGDVSILSASERMNLMPFAQISSRLGGAFILIVQGILIRLLF